MPEKLKNNQKKILFIGCGQMGFAILKSILKKNIFQDISIVDPSISNEKIEEITQQSKNNINISFYHDHSQLNNIKNDFFNFIFIAVKPQVIDEILPFYKRFSSAIFYSIMAGKEISYLEKALSSKIKIARCMPNLCASIGKSSSLLCFNKNVNQEDKTLIKKFTKSFGSIYEVNEKLFDEMTIISGCLPAFFALLSSSLQNAMSKEINQKKAEKIIKETMMGTGKVLLKNKKNFEDFISSVCSKKGVTEVGVETFRNSFFALAEKAKKLMIERTRELKK